jgi:hypothetical protein
MVSSDSLVTVFDALEDREGYWGGTKSLALPLLAMGLASVVGGLTLYLRRSARRASWRPLIVVGCLLMTMSYFVFNSIRDGYERLANDIVRVPPLVVEGTVERFVAQGMSGSPKESFRVNGQDFWYYTGDVTPFYHRLAKDGGVIRDGLWVRLTHQNGRIVRIQVSKGTSLRQ